MSDNLEEFVDVRTHISPAAGAVAKLHQEHAAGGERLVVAESVDPDNFRRLLDSLTHEDCAHSWRNFSPDGTADGLLQWENEHRPTRIFYFYLKSGEETRMIAAGAVADKLTRHFPHPGFCVIGRCYIMPQFRGRGFYREILRYRLEHCRSQFGNSLNGIHIGSVNERISRVITNHGFSGWPRFTHLGEEALSVAGQIKTVGAYLLFVPEYARKIRKALSGHNPPACVLELRNALSKIESGDISNLGLLIKKPYEDALGFGWFDERGSEEFEQLLAFCSSIPLVGFR